MKGITRFEAARMYFETLCQSGGLADQEISSNLATETSPLFRDEEPVEIGPPLLLPNSNLATDVNLTPNLLSPVVTSLESEEDLSIYTDAKTKAEESVTAEILIGDVDLVKKEEDCTVTTIAESLDEISSCESSTRKEFSVVVNGTIYTGIKSSSDDSSCDATVNANEVSAIEGETLKDRNRRLLIQERESRGRKKIRSSKESVKHPRPSPILSTIKEEDGCNIEECILLEAESDRAAELSIQDDTTANNRNWEIERMLQQRIVKRRQTSRPCGQSKSKKNRSMVKRRALAEQMRLPGLVSKIIRLYSSSAGRYAMFRSNRRYKPGD